MINTQLADVSIFVLTLISTWFLGNYFYRFRQTEVKKIPVLLLVFAAVWAALNMVGHLLAVLWVNIVRMQQGAFTYTFHFYALLLMGVVFLSLNLFQLQRIKLLIKGKFYLQQQLLLSCLVLSVLSLPLFPLNPIGLQPVLCSAIIALTITLTKKQWRKTHLNKVTHKSYATSM